MCVKLMNKVDVLHLPAHDFRTDVFDSIQSNRGKREKKGVIGVMKMRNIVPRVVIKTSGIPGQCANHYTT